MTRILMAALAALCLVAGAAWAQAPIDNDVRTLRVGMPAVELPASGFADFACAGGGIATPATRRTSSSANRTSPCRWSSRMRREAVCLAALLATATPAFAADPAIAFKAAWAPAGEQGTDTNLYLTAVNGGAEDAIVRVRCDVANFTELRTVDLGEGFPSARAVKSIPVTAGGETMLKAEGFNIRLLQLTRKLAAGDAFDCALRLRGGSQQTVSVAVRPTTPGAE